MKVSLNNSLGINHNNNVTFNGYKKVKSNTGEGEFEFHFPFDEKKYQCFLEIYEAYQDEHGNYYSGKVKTRFDDNPEADGLPYFELKSGKNIVNLKTHYFMENTQPFAYHYRLKNRQNNQETYKIDVGTIIDERGSGQAHKIFNIVPPNSPRYNRGGAMKLFLPDTYKPGYVYNKSGNIISDAKTRDAAKTAVRTFSNRLGGTLAGVEKGLDDGDFDAYSHLIGTPIFTDSLSPAAACVDGGHGYWNKNNYQMSHSLGNIGNWANLQKKLFAKGKNWVSDGAFVNEGLTGIHFKHLEKWGDKSYAANWFRKGDGPLAASILPKSTDIVTHKIINSPYSYKPTYDGKIKIEKKPWDPTKPFVVQVFDKRLATEESRRDPNNPIHTYDKLNTDNPLEINTHNDTMPAYYFYPDPEEYKANVIRLSEYNQSVAVEDQIPMDSYLGTKILTKFKNVSVEDKNVESNVDTWDANPDIAKLNFVSSHADTIEGYNIEDENIASYYEDIESHNTEVQDYIISSAKYWTRKTNQILNLHVAQNLKKLDATDAESVYKAIQDKVAEGVFPESIGREINLEIVQNVLDGKYKLKKLSSGDFMTQLSAALMDVPLDSIELGDDIAATFAAPYISKKATYASDIGRSRSELWAKGNIHLPQKYEKLYKRTESLYVKKGEMYDFANRVLSEVNRRLYEEQGISLIKQNKDATQFGKYALQHVSGEIVKFGIIKALFPDAEVSYNSDTKQFIYDYDKLKNTTLYDLYIREGSPEKEASALLSKVESGLDKLKGDKFKVLEDGIYDMLKGMDENSFKLAEVIVDKSGAGLDWRIDATKDIADIEALKNKNTDFEYTWNNVIKFWKRFTENVLEENPNAYMVAEVTNEFDLYKAGRGDLSEKYSNLDDYDNENNMESINMKTLRETGMTSIANYSYLFSLISQIFAKSFENGKEQIEFPNGDKDPTPHNIGRLLHDKFVDPGMFKNYLKTTPIESLVYSYIFIGNHDKPRAIHAMALDMGMFFTNLTNADNEEYRQRAYRVLNDDYMDEHGNATDVSKAARNYDFSRIDQRAIAMAEVLRGGMINALNELAPQKSSVFGEGNYNKIFAAISKSAGDLANGKFKDKVFEAGGLGVKEFQVVIDIMLKQMEHEYKVKFNKEDRKAIADKAFESIVKPANTKLIGMQKYLAAMIGNPTLYAGDDLASTGSETETKNIDLGNRGFLHFEWADKNSPDYKEFVGEGKKIIDKEMGIRADYKNHALNDGAPIMLKLQYGKDSDIPVTAIFRHSTDGAMAVSLFNPTGMNRSNQLEYHPQEVRFESIDLSQDPNNSDVGLGFGLQPNTKFVDTRTGNAYYVRELNGHYMIKGNTGSGKYKDDRDVVMNDTTLVLTHMPSFTGKMNKVLVTNPYAKPKEIQMGSKLSLTK